MSETNDCKYCVHYRKRPDWEAILPKESCALGYALYPALGSCHDFETDNYEEDEVPNIFEEDFDVDLDDDDDDALFNDPCFDCDDLKVPYAARHCSECPHGTKEKPLTESQRKILDHDDDANYRYDMWGPDAI